MHLAEFLFRITAQNAATNQTFLIAAFYMEPKSEKITCKLWHVAGNISKM